MLIRIILVVALLVASIGCTKKESEFSKRFSKPDYFGMIDVDPNDGSGRYPAQIGKVTEMTKFIVEMSKVTGKSTESLSKTFLLIAKSSSRYKNFTAVNKVSQAVEKGKCFELLGAEDDGIRTLSNQLREDFMYKRLKFDTNSKLLAKSERAAMGKLDDVYKAIYKVKKPKSFVVTKVYGASETGKVTEASADFLYKMERYAQGSDLGTISSKLGYETDRLFYDTVKSIAKATGKNYDELVATTGKEIKQLITLYKDAGIPNTDSLIGYMLLTMKNTEGGWKALGPGCEVAQGSGKTLSISADLATETLNTIMERAWKNIFEAASKGCAKGKACRKIASEDATKELFYAWMKATGRSKIDDCLAAIPVFMSLAKPPCNIFNKNMKSELVKTFCH